jgi:rare lipoprotein A
MAIMRTYSMFAAGLLWLLLLLSSAPAGAQTAVALGHTEVGVASFYHDRFHGRTTANGERFDQSSYSAAHRTLPFGTKVRVTRVDTGRSVVVTINDRGPFRKGRVVDLSLQAARDLGMIDQGLVKVKVEVLRLPVREA